MSVVNYSNERPIVSGVYMLFQEHNLVYVGKSQDSYARISEHRANGRVFDYALISSCPASDMGWIESALIKAFQPQQNSSLKGPKALPSEVSTPAAPPKAADQSSTQIAYTIPQAVAAMGIHRTTIYRLAQEGKLPLTKVRGRTLILRADMDRLFSGAAE